MIKGDACTRAPADGLTLGSPMNWKALSTWFYLGAIAFILYVLSYPLAAVLDPAFWSLETRMAIVAAVIFIPFFLSMIWIVWRSTPIRSNPEDGDKTPAPQTAPSRTVS